MLGSTVGDYRITEKLGEGGFGVVYRAVHRLSEQEVAIKTIDSVLTTDPKFRDRFFAEARIQARLKHPNIVVMHNFFEHESRYYIVLEYMEGLVLPNGSRVRTLADLIRQGPLPENRLVELFREMLGAIGYAHGHGILHRDVKPLNMLFSESGAIKVADFGIAKMVGGETSVALSGARVGTPAYMSPEQVFDKKLTRATDIYSMGCTLYEAATGKLPFKESDTSSLFEAHVSEPPVRPRQVNPQMSERLEDVILRAMQKKPQDRFQSCDEFAATLKTVSVRPESERPAAVSAGPEAWSAVSRVEGQTEPEQKRTRREPEPKIAAPSPERQNARFAQLADRIAKTIAAEARSPCETDDIEKPGTVERVVTFLRSLTRRE